MVFNINPVENNIGQRLLPVQDPMISQQVESTEVMTPPQSSVPFGNKERKPTTGATPQVQKENIVSDNPLSINGRVSQNPPSINGRVSDAPPAIERGQVSQNPPSLERGVVSDQPPAIERGLVSEQPPAIERGQVSAMPPSIDRATETRKAGDIAYNAISRAIDRGQKINEEDKENIIARLAEVRNVDPNEVRAIFDQRMGQQNIRTVDDMSEKVDRDIDMVNTLTQKLTPEQLATVVSGDTLPPEVRNKLMQTPQYMEALQLQKQQQKAQSLNNQVSGEDEGLEKPSVDTKELEQTMANGGELTENIKQDIRQLNTDPGLTSLATEISDIDTEIIDLQNQLNNIADTVVNELGQTTTKAALNAIIYDRQVSLQSRLNTTLSMRQAKEAQYQRIKQEKELDIQRTMQRQQQMMDTLNANNGMALLGTTQAELDQLEAMGQIPQGYAQLYGNMVESMIGNTLSQLGPLNDEDIRDIQAGLASGQTPQEILSRKLQQPRFQQKIQDPNIGKVVKSGDSSFQYNPTTGMYDIEVGGNTGYYGEGPMTGDVQQDFAIFFGRFNDYEGNKGVDYPVTKGTPIPAPVDMTINRVERHNSGNIRVKATLSTGETVNFDHLDPSTLSHLGLEGLSEGQSVDVNQMIPMGQYMGFVGNTGNVKTKSGGEWVTPTDEQRAAGAGSHLSFEMYDPQTGNAIPVEQAYRRLQGHISSNYQARQEKPIFESLDMNQSESNAWLFGTRMNQANDIIEEFSDQLPNTLIGRTALKNRPRWSQPDWYKQMEQAQRNFINAVLRRESGAAISPDEFESARLQYFPQFGDGEAVREQKAENRRLAIEGLGLATGHKPEFDAYIDSMRGGISQEDQAMQNQQVNIQEFNQFAQMFSPDSVMQLYNQAGGSSITQ